MTSSFRFRFHPALRASIALCIMLTLPPCAHARLWSCSVFYDGKTQTERFHLMIEAPDAVRAKSRALVIAPQDRNASRRIPSCSSAYNVVSINAISH